MQFFNDMKIINKINNKFFLVENDENYPLIVVSLGNVR